jgi:hypothetical protein
MEIVFNDKKPENIFVSSSAKENQPKPKKEVKFKSDRTNRTELETWKRPELNTNINANLSSGGRKGREQKAKEEFEEQERERLNKDGDYYVADQRKPLYLPGFSGTQSQPQIPTYIQERLPPGAQLGNITSLNTDQNKYYSFNQRLIARLVPIWGNMVRNALYQWIEENNSPPISKSWVTNVEVIMDKNGEILEVQPMRLSGLWSIDQAAIESFKKVEKVPNPPKEMVDENGYIHIQFQTEVHWIPQPGIRYHGGGP